MLKGNCEARMFERDSVKGMWKDRGSQVVERDRNSVEIGVVLTGDVLYSGVCVAPYTEIRE